jgi:hypothetical protein
MPSDANPLTGLPQRNVRTDGINATRDFVSGHARIFQRKRPVPFFDDCVAMANATGFNLNSDLAFARFRNRSLNQLEISPGAGNLNGFHIRHEGSLLNRGEMNLSVKSFL